MTDAVDTPHYRPAFHFTPQRWWMNDPNGLVVHAGVFHLFFQYHPHSLLWGPMHWGHATSRDLLHWQEHAVALAPDAKGMVFSGSVVIDTRNDSGFGAGGRAPWVAVYTQFDSAAGAAGRIDNQHQGVAHSLDEGFTWVPHEGNPVMPNPGLKDFRDPKVLRDAPRERWLMVLAAGDRVQFHASTDLRAWTQVGEFGADAGAHGSVWECPDLIELDLEGRRRWVLIVSVIEGGPNGGSATQYFVGDFDGARFVPEHADVRWLDHGSDNYAGVTWHNSGARALFVGWMSNWDYARQLPTAPWRGAMTLPRQLSLRRVGDATRLVQALPQEVAAGFAHDDASEWTLAGGETDLGAAWAAAGGRLALQLQAPVLGPFTLELSNDAGDLLRLGHDAAAGTWWLDRTRAGVVDFHPAFASRQTMPRLGTQREADVTLVFDATSVECFTDGGLSAMTCLFFPRAPFTRAVLDTAACMAGGQARLAAHRAR